MQTGKVKYDVHAICVSVVLLCLQGFLRPQKTSNDSVHAFCLFYDRMEIKEILKNTLRKEPNLLSDKGEIKKWIVINKAQNYDETLLGLLLDEPRLKTIFFKEIKKAWVFNLNLFTDFIEQKEFLPDSYTGFPNKIGLQIGGKFLRQRNEVSLVWPYKDCILEGGQSREEDTRKEIFFNELLAQDEITQLFEPKVITNLQYFGDATELNHTSNLLIKGNNLLALHSLKKCFTGKVKLIYIDPPYNTGNDGFRYNDSFNHSSWLTFMKNRLEVAKTLLREDGVIFINIDDIEQAYLKVLCDEIFGSSNFVNTIAIKSSTPSGTKTAHRTRTIIKQKDLILVYKKSHFIEFNPQFTKRESWDSHYSLFIEKNKDGNYTLRKLTDVLKENLILVHNQKIENLRIEDKLFKKFYLENANSICRLQSHKNKSAEKESRKLSNAVYEHFENGISKGLYYNGQVITPLAQGIKRVYSNQKYSEDLGMLLCDFWADIDFQNTQNEGGVNFPTAKKPELLIARILELATNKDDIVLDFHLGSGTTASVAHKMKRQYIGIEQMNYGNDDSLVRLKKVIDGEQSGVSKAYNWQGGGGFVYLELKKYNEHFVEKISDCQSTDELLEVWEEMKKVSFLNYNIDIKDQDKAIEELKTHSLEVQKQKLVSILDKNQLYVSVSNIDDAQYGVTDQEKEFTKAFYQHD